MAGVVVGVPLDLARAQRQHGLRAVERLDLGLLVDREDDGAVGRVEVEPDDVADLGLEGRIGGELEGLGAVRLQAQLGPQAVHRGGAHATGRRHAAHAPVGRALGRWAQREGQEPVAVLAAVRRRVARSGSVGEPREARLRIPAAPELHGHEAPRRPRARRAPLAAPSAERSTMRARVTSRCSLVGARMTASRTALSASGTDSGGAGA